MRKEIPLFIVVMLGAALSACTAQTTPPSTTPSWNLTPTYTLPTTPTTTVEPWVFPDNGYITLNGFGELFKFQRVFDYISQPTYFEGVIFTPHKEAPGVTSSGPIAYKIDVQFADGTVEVLQYIGLGNTNNFDINLTKHEHPKAGMLLSWQDVCGGLQEVLYLLVSEQ
jgi:hypothetical protein